MSVTTNICYFPSKPNSIKPNPCKIITSYSKHTPNKKHSPPLYISTNPTQINIYNIQKLYSLCTYSPNRFPLNFDSKNVPLDKLRIAVFNSDVVVSVFAHSHVVSYYRDTKGDVGGNELFWGWRVMPVNEENGELVGFGRAVSDGGLTASIYDVMVVVSYSAKLFIPRYRARIFKVLPSLQGMGIGQKIVKQILRILTSRGIYDISALCSDQERLFFKACGFGNDILESTTMMYTRTASTCEENQAILEVGRKQLLVPPDKKPSRIELTKV